MQAADSAAPAVPAAAGLSPQWGGFGGSSDICWNEEVTVGRKVQSDQVKMSLIVALTCIKEEILNVFDLLGSSNSCI